MNYSNFSTDLDEFTLRSYDQLGYENINGYDTKYGEGAGYGEGYGSEFEDGDGDGDSAGYGFGYESEYMFEVYNS
jgi:hypothetical protein